MGFGYQRQSLGPSERGAFAGAVERRFTPGIEQAKTLLALATLAGSSRVHVKAHRAAVDLRRADLHEFHQALLQASLEDALAEIEPLLHRRGCGGERVESGCHGHLLRQSSS